MDIVLLRDIEKKTMESLKDFQCATVERVDELFRNGQNRVLVADEVGMGKTLIARGVISKTSIIQCEADDDLFKIVYICSNQVIAKQNIQKLDRFLLFPGLRRRLFPARRGLYRRADRTGYLRLPLRPLVLADGKGQRL